jgi:hypothetical protein
MSRKKTLIEWQEQSNLIHNNEFKIIDNPNNANHVIRVKHEVCGNIIKISMNNHMKRYCRYCSGKHKRCKEEWQYLSDEIHNNQFEILEEPVNGKTKISILHKKCGNIIKMTMNNHINHKNGCKNCSKYSHKTHEYWINKSLDIWSEDYNILGYINNVHDKVDIVHNICKRTHKKSMDSFINGKRGCPFCYKDLKYAENYIKEYLTSKCIDFEQEKTFDDLINPKTGRKLRYDFYLPNHRFVIETNGVQHYKPIEQWGGESVYIEQVYRDELKKKYLIDNNINYIIINNKNLTKIKSIL